MQKSIVIEEQGLRDGIQNLDTIVSTERKLKIIDQLIEAGIKRIQIASFVHPKLVPQMADAENVCKSVKKQEGILYSGLVLNVKGVERGIAAGLNHLACSISASDTHSQKNARKTLTEARSAFEEMVALCEKNQIATRGGIQCAFGCRYEGDIAHSAVLDLVKHHLDSGIDELAVADSTGMGNPMAVEELMSQVIELADEIPVVLHLHNTENKGYANLYAAVKSGVKIFDTAFGGLGGCPFIKNATGNIATEDTIHLLDQMGYSTGIDKLKIAAISGAFARTQGGALPSQMYQLLNDSSIEIN